jgi:hypothetical protein
MNVLRRLTGERLADCAAVAILAAVAIAALATFRDYGLGWDDFTHAQMGEKLIALFASGFRDTEALSFVNLYMYGGGFDMLAALLAKTLPFGLFETRRLVGAGVGLVGLFATWRLARRVGGPSAGLMALTLLAVCPIFYGHMFMNAKDAPFAVAMAVLLLGLVRVIEDYPSPSRASVVLFGLGLGLTLGTRIMGVIAGFYALAALAFLILYDARTQSIGEALGRFGRFMLRLLPGFVGGYLLMGLLWPWSVAAPLNPFRALTYFSVFFEKPWREVFRGEIVSVLDMPASYLPTLMALKLPEIMTALAVTGTLLIAWRILRGDSTPQRRAAWLLLVVAALGPVLLVVTTRPAMYNGLRHFLFLLPPIAVLGGIGGAFLLAQAQRLGRPALAAATVALLIGFASPAIEMVRLHPYQYTHFNRIEGGVRGVANNFMLDYWGLSFKQAAQQLRATLAAREEPPPEGRRWKVAVCGPHPAARVELGEDFEVSWDPQGADFALMLGTYYCMQYLAPVLAQVERDGVVYARAYDVRHRSYSTLFTTPPP